MRRSAARRGMTARRRRRQAAGHRGGLSGRRSRLQGRARRPAARPADDRPGHRCPRLRRDHRSVACPVRVPSYDALLPACEDDDTLTSSLRSCPVFGVPFLFDLDGYAVTQSKLRSDELLAAPRRAAPAAPGRRCGYPASSSRRRQRQRGRRGGIVGARARLRPRSPRGPGAAGRRREFVAGPSLSVDIGLVQG